MARALLGFADTGARMLSLMAECLRGVVWGNYKEREMRGRDRGRERRVRRRESERKREGGRERVEGR